jgi:hypothetical protein
LAIGRAAFLAPLRANHNYLALGDSGKRQIAITIAEKLSTSTRYRHEERLSSRKKSREKAREKSQKKSQKKSCEVQRNRKRNIEIVGANELHTL